jgi:DNA repair protein RadA/Sms
MIQLLIAVVAAILSSNEDIPVNKDFCFAGEVGLSEKFVLLIEWINVFKKQKNLDSLRYLFQKYNKIALKNTGIKIGIVAKSKKMWRACFG